MTKKKTIYSEASYFIGLFILAFGTAMMTKGDLGMSMVVTPAYLLHLKLSAAFPWFSFGMAEYVLQAVLLVLLGIFLRSFKPMYLFSFITAVLYGFMLDACLGLLGLLPFTGLFYRFINYLFGFLIGSFGVAMLFHTYIAPEAYELFVKEVAGKYRLDMGKTKTIYDCTSCVISIIMSFAFFGFGHFEGVKWGTVVCALLNGTLIGYYSRFLENNFEYKDKFAFRKYFE